MLMRFWVRESLLEKLVPKLVMSIRVRGPTLGGLTAIIFPVPVPSPGFGMAKRRVIGFSRNGLASHGSAPTTAAKGAIL